MSRIRTLVVAVVGALAIFEASPGLAVEKYEENIRVIQQKPFLRKMRAEVSPFFGVNVNDARFRHMGLGFVANFYPIENLSVGATYTTFNWFGLGASNDLLDWSYMTDAGKRSQQDTLQYPRLIDLRQYVGGQLSYLPVYGKFILFGTWIVHFDAYLTAGAGAFWTRTGVHPSGNIGLGAHLFLTRWLTLFAESRVFMHREDFRGTNSLGDEFVTNVMFQTGFSFFLPPSFTYRYAK